MPIGSMVLLYMVTWIPSYMDPMGMGEAQKLPGFDTINTKMVIHDDWMIWEPHDLGNLQMTENGANILAILASEVGLSLELPDAKPRNPNDDGI